MEDAGWDQPPREASSWKWARSGAEAQARRDAHGKTSALVPSRSALRKSTVPQPGLADSLLHDPLIRREGTGLTSLNADYTVSAGPRCADLPQTGVCHWGGAARVCFFLAWKMVYSSH